MCLILKGTSFCLRISIIVFPGEERPGIHIVVFFPFVEPTGTPVANLPEFVCSEVAVHVDESFVQHVLCLPSRGLLEVFGNVDGGLLDLPCILVCKDCGEVGVATGFTTEITNPHVW